MEPLGCSQTLSTAVIPYTYTYTHQQHIQTTAHTYRQQHIPPTTCIQKKHLPTARACARTHTHTAWHMPQARGEVKILLLSDSHWNHLLWSPDSREMPGLLTTADSCHSCFEPLTVWSFYFFSPIVDKRGLWSAVFEFQEMKQKWGLVSW